MSACCFLQDTQTCFSFAGPLTSYLAGSLQPAINICVFIKAYAQTCVDKYTYTHNNAIFIGFPGGWQGAAEHKAKHQLLHADTASAAPPPTAVATPPIEKPEAAPLQTDLDLQAAGVFVGVCVYVCFVEVSCDCVFFLVASARPRPCPPLLPAFTTTFENEGPRCKLSCLHQRPLN